MSRRTTARTKPPTVQMVSDGHDLFVVADGVKIAKRGKRGTPQAKTWVSLEPGWSVLDKDVAEGLMGEGEIEISYNGVRVH
jgi:hypothetical protein